VVALGDSITDGVGSALGGENRWPNLLARRLDARPGASLGVLDEGIGGNRLLSDPSCCGVNALARFGRDVRDRAGARAVIVLEGVNDITASRHAGSATAPHADVSAAQIIGGLRQLVALAHAAGLRVFGATITPFRGARYWSAAAEAKRSAVNAWIRSGGGFDGVIDFARVLADPRAPQTLRHAYDSGDHLHPDPAGYRRMAAAIDLPALIRAAH
jgi:lysophospholipase L1-like esterase